MQKMSIIVPCYTSGDRLVQCFESLLNSNDSNVEIIAVIDSAATEAIEQLSAYEEKYGEQLLLVLCDDNTSIGSACHIGLSYATGDSVRIVDYNDHSRFDLLKQLQGNMQSYMSVRNEDYYGKYKNEIDIFFLFNVYIRPIIITANNKQEYPIKLFKALSSWVMEMIPDWENNECVQTQLNAEERKALNLLKKLDKSDEWIEEQLKYLYYGQRKKDIISYLDEMVEAIETKAIFDERILKYNNQHLTALFLLENENRNADVYYKLYNRVINWSLEKNKTKIQKGEKLRVAFLPYSSAEWPAEKLYRKLVEDERFDPYIVPMPLVDRDYIFRKKTYNSTLDFFIKNNYIVKEIYDVNKDISYGWEEIGGIADIIIHLSLWDNAIPYPYQISEYPFGTLAIYIPYGITVEESDDELYKRDYTFNRPGMNILWKTYVDSIQTFEEYKRYELLQAKNAVYSGYMKMDYFYQENFFTDEIIKKLWNIPNHIDVNDMKRVIIAPHHTISDEEILPFSTFEKNKDYLLELAREYKDRISFVLKPHPNLGVKSVEAGIFKSIEGYEEYLDSWRTLSNCKVVEEASYLDYFASSDGMIMDSISFIAEYMYTNKPMLFLQRDTQRFNELGSKLMDVHYKVLGTDFDGIKQFIEEVILNEQDTHKPVREKVFAEELDYVAKTGMLAGEYVYNDIVNSLTAN